MKRGLVLKPVPETAETAGSGRFDPTDAVRKVIVDGMSSYPRHKLSTRHLREMIEEIDDLRDKVRTLEARLRQTAAVIAPLLIVLLLAGCAITEKTLECPQGPCKSWGVSWDTYPYTAPVRRPQ